MITCLRVLGFLEEGDWEEVVGGEDRDDKKEWSRAAGWSRRRGKRGKVVFEFFFKNIIYKILILPS